jgi:hypothetical protein
MAKTMRERMALTIGEVLREEDGPSVATMLPLYRECADAARNE